jgi:hypothetical protein
LKILQFFQGRSARSDAAGQRLHSVPHSLNGMSRDDMICACQRMATKELALASAATGGERVDHIYSAASWSERADLLQRIEDRCQQKEMRDGGS